MVAVLATVVYGQQCTDTDGGVDYGNKGSVKYGITTQSDTCILSKRTEMSVDEGNWLKEYYCDDNQRKSDNIDCLREGYTKCEMGACTGKDAVAAKKEAEKAAAPKCGNKVVDSGEDCDPPGKICYVDGGYGQCDSNCKCPLELGKAGVVKSNATANATEANVTAAEGQKEPESEPLPEIETVEPVEIEPEEIDVPEQPLPNFIVRFINWIKGLFS